ncbi:MAG: PAS domain S-box protein [Acidobacteriia bacterium]|nr:PAS domain S-box protein [Terriglobia bacterium]
MTTPEKAHLEEQYRQLIEQVPAITYMAERGPHGRWYYVSPQIQPILAFTPEEWMSDPERWRKQVHPDDLERVLVEEQGLAREGDRYRTEYRLRTRDGKDVWVRDEATYVRHQETGNLVMRGLLLDITERKEAEEELRRTEQRLQTTVNAAPVVLFAVDPAGLFTLSVGRGLQALGLKPGEVVGRSVFDLYRDQPDILHHVRRALSAEEFTTVVELPQLQLVYETQWTSTRDSAGHLTGATGVATDITERRKAEEALRRSEERYRVFVGQISEGIYRTEYDPPISIHLPADEQAVLGIGSGRYAECNDALARMYGFHSASEMIGRRMSEFVSMDDPLNRASIGAFIANGYRISDAESREQDASGNTRIFRNSVIGIVENEKLVRIWGVQRDVTERLQLEEQLRTKQELEAIGRLAGGVAHDFNNLVGIILGHTELLSAGSGLTERVKNGLDQIRRAGERAASLTHQLLAFSRKQVLQPRVLDLNAIVADVQKMLSRVIGEDIEVVTRLHPSLAAVKADPVQIEQVLMNLAVNARDAMPHGGTLLIETADVELDEVYARQHPGFPAGPSVRLTVSDTGHGMDAETLEHVFEPFFTTKELGKGTGMGLATVYGIVTQSGGNISVSSTIGKGTAFQVYLPAEKALAETRVEEAVEVVAGGTETILVVEDEPNLREITRIFLEDYGYRVLEAIDAKGAIQVAKTFAEPIHLTLTDVIMPGMSGRQVAEQIVSARPGMKVVYMTGYTDNMVAQHNVLEPGIALLQKPFDKVQLARIIRSVLDRS